jgi:hypothetical protein
MLIRIVESYVGPAQYFTLSIANRPSLLARSANGVEESLTRALDPDRLFTLIRHHHPRINQGTHHKQAGQLFCVWTMTFGRSTRFREAPIEHFSAVLNADCRDYGFRAECFIYLLV